MLGILTSYIKARAEGVGLSADVGVVERTERLILVLVGTGFTGLGIPYALHVALWILLVGSAVTVGQRFLAVRRAGRTRRATCAMSDAAPRRPSTPAPGCGPGCGARLTDAGFAAGWGAVKLLPESVAHRVFDGAGRWAAGRDGRGVRQLRANLRVATGGRLSEAELDELTERAVRSYARYWQEAFRLPVIEPGRIVGNTVTTGQETSTGCAPRGGRSCSRCRTAATGTPPPSGSSTGSAARS